MNDRYIELERQMERSEHDYITEPEWDDDDDEDDEVEILTAPRDMYLCLYAVEDLLHRLCVMYEDADGSADQLRSLSIRINEYQVLKLRLKSKIKEMEKP